MGPLPLLQPAPPHLDLPVARAPPVADDKIIAQPIEAPLAMGLIQVGGAAPVRVRRLWWDQDPLPTPLCSATGGAQPSGSRPAWRLGPITGVGLKLKSRPEA